MKVDDADKMGVYPVIAQWDNGKYVVLVGEHTESEDYDNYEDAVTHLHALLHLHQMVQEESK